MDVVLGLLIGGVIALTGVIIGAALANIDSGSKQ